jgi:hypothetical protein
VKVKFNQILVHNQGNYSLALGSLRLATVIIILLLIIVVTIISSGGGISCELELAGLPRVDSGQYNLASAYWFAAVNPAVKRT